MGDVVDGEKGWGFRYLSSLESKINGLLDESSYTNTNLRSGIVTTSNEE